MYDRTTFAKLPVSSWFILPRDPNQGPLFKCDERSAMDRQYHQLFVSRDEEVIVAKLPDSASTNETISNRGD